MTKMEYLHKGFITAGLREIISESWLTAMHDPTTKRGTPKYGLEWAPISTETQHG